MSSASDLESSVSSLTAGVFGCIACPSAGLIYSKGGAEISNPEFNASPRSQRFNSNGSKALGRRLHERQRMMRAGRLVGVTEQKASSRYQARRQGAAT